MNTRPPLPNLHTIHGSYDIWDLFGLNSSEKKVMQSISGLAKNPVLISRHTKIPQTSISYTLQKLKKRGLVRTINKENGRVNWKSNLPQIMRYIRSLPVNKPGLF